MSQSIYWYYLIDFILEIINFTVGLPVTHKTSAILIQVLTAFVAPETLRVPFQIGCHSQYELIIDRATASETHRYSFFLFKKIEFQNG